MEQQVYEDGHRNYQDCQGRLGKPAKNGCSIGNEQNKINYSHITGNNFPQARGSTAKDKRRETIGGILRRLAIVEESNLEFVDAHTQRLKKRLADDKRQREQIKQEIEELRTEVLSLLELEEE